MTEPLTMGDKPENPSAFPIATIDGCAPGMDLRDWFAGHALAGMLVTDRCPDAKDAYALADAMLAERLRHD